jgi:hypothetical protein
MSKRSKSELKPDIRTPTERHERVSACSDTSSLVLVIREFIATQKWDERPSLTVTKELVQACLAVPCSNDVAWMHVHGWRDINELQIAIHLPINCDQAYKSELAILINGLHNEHIAGRFQYLPDHLDNAICWMFRIGLDGLQISGKLVSDLATVGWMICDHYFDAIESTATLGTSSEMALVSASYLGDQSFGKH